MSVSKKRADVYRRSRLLLKRDGIISTGTYVEFSLYIEGSIFIGSCPEMGRFHIRVNTSDRRGWRTIIFRVDGNSEWHGDEHDLDMVIDALKPLMVLEDLANA